MKKILSCILFCLILFGLLARVEDILIPKTTNRYYILENYLEDVETDFDVQVFGSCHAYTSFNPAVLQEAAQLDSFVFANAGEIIPTTYLRMLEQFKNHIPKVAVVEIWGINPYETYDTTERILGAYLKNNIQLLPFSLEKLEVVNDFNTLDPAEMYFPISQYKDRIIERSLLELDFDYAFNKIVPTNPDYTVGEMTTRMEYNGFKPLDVGEIPEYTARQNVVESTDVLEIESNVSKYVVKIIELCKKYDVELIFYRAPYVSSVNELRKLNHFRQICDEHGVLFLDSEQEIDYDYTTDFCSYEHLSEVGATKSTEFLLPYILEAAK